MATVGVFIDYDNIHIGLEKYDSPKRIDPEKFTLFRQIGLQYGTVKKVSAYAVWDNFRAEREYFEQAGVSTVSIFSNLKNATDISLTVDCLHSAIVDKLDVIVLFSGDGGYAPLVKYLVDSEKTVYIFSVKNGMNTKAYNWLSENHIILEEHLPDCIVDKNTLDPKLLDLVKVLHDAYEIKKFPFVSLSYFSKHLRTRKEFLELGEKCSDLIAEATTLNLIKDTEERDSTDGRKMRVVRVNYDHPAIKVLSLKND